MADEEQNDIDLLDELQAALAEQTAEPAETEPAEKDTDDTESTAQTVDEETADWFEKHVDSLPESVKEVVASMNKESRDYFADVEKQRADAIAQGKERDEKLKAAEASIEEFDEIFEPFRDVLESQGMSKAQVTRTLLQAKMQLDANPSEVIKNWAKSYGINLTSGDAETEETGEPVNSDVAKLRRELDELKQAQAQETHQREAELAKDVKSTLKEFEDAKDDDGQSLHPHYGDKKVQDLMAGFMQTGSASDLDEAYDMAVMANPATRKEAFEAMDRAKELKAEEERKSDVKRRAKEAERLVSGGADDSGEKVKDKEPPTLEEEMLAEVRRQQNAA